MTSPCSPCLRVDWVVGGEPCWCSVVGRHIRLGGEEGKVSVVDLVANGHDSMRGVPFRAIVLIVDVRSEG
jgi:hypothetical protein